MANILLSCWEYSRYHKQVLPVTGFWQFDRIVDSKVGLNPPFHYHVVPWIDLILAASNKQLFTTHKKRGRTILVILTVIQSEISVVVTGWKDVILTNENSVKWQPRLVSQNHICNDDPRTVRAETG